MRIRKIYIACIFIAVILSASVSVFILIGNPLASNINVSSEVPNLKISVNNKLFNTYVREWRIFEKELLFDRYPPIAINNLSITLSNRLQPYQIILDESNQQIQSIGVTIKDDVLILSVYINPTIISKKTNLELSNKVSFMVLLQLYDLSHPQTQITQTNKFLPIYRKLNNGKDYAFYVEKK